MIYFKYVIYNHFNTEILKGCGTSEQNSKAIFDHAEVFIYKNKILI